MNRVELIQGVFKRTSFKNYLEIGALSGNTFLRIKAKYKTAVDPSFKIPFEKKVKWLIKEPKNFNNKYFKEESDSFFTNRKTYLKKVGSLGVVLVDGLHTFRASLNDVLNSLKYLDKNGIIIMHDCYPSNEAAALPTKLFPTEQEQKSAKGWTGEWCGDVWKTIPYLLENLQGLLDVHVLNCDHGLGIIRIKNKIDEKDLVISESQFSKINKLTYKDFEQNTEALLNLKPADYAETILSEISAGNINK